MDKANKIETIAKYAVVFVFYSKICFTYVIGWDIIVSYNQNRIENNQTKGKLCNNKIQKLGSETYWCVIRRMPN